MTISSFFSIIGLALLDCLNPATIATMIVLLPLVGKKWHAIVFIVGTFLMYFTAGLLAFFGNGNAGKSHIGPIGDQCAEHPGPIVSRDFEFISGALAKRGKNFDINAGIILSALKTVWRRGWAGLPRHPRRHLGRPQGHAHGHLRGSVGDAHYRRD